MTKLGVLALALSSCSTEESNPGLNATDTLDVIETCYEIASVTSFCATASEPLVEFANQHNCSRDELASMATLFFGEAQIGLSDELLKASGCA